MSVIGQVAAVNPVNLGVNNEISTSLNSDKSFAGFLSDALNNVNNLQSAAEQASVDLAAGKTSDIHNVMIATEKANLAISLAVQVRNKVVEAYQEMMRMQF